MHRWVPGTDSDWAGSHHHAVTQVFCILLWGGVGGATAASWEVAGLLFLDNFIFLA